MNVIDRMNYLTEPAQADLQSRDQRIASLRETCLKDVYRYLYRRTRSTEEAEDLTAETFAAALSALPKGRLLQPRAWLLGIAKRKLADSLRKRFRNKEMLLSELKYEAATEDAPDTRVERDERIHKIREIVEELPKDQREALLFQYLEDLSIAEIAEIMGKSPAAVNSLLQRARVAVFNGGRAYFLDTFEVKE